MAYSGFHLTEMEANLIENSLIILQSENKFRDIFFFARFDTSSNDRYYIAFGYKNDIFKDQKYFYSLNGYEWLMLPEVKPNLFAYVPQMTSMLTGDPMNVEEFCKNPNFVADREEVFIECPRSTKKIKEEDRLSCLVHLIIQGAAIHARGVLYRQLSGFITHNPHFQGLSRLDASEMKNFQLFRYPCNNLNFNLTKRSDYNYQTDFFDSIDDLTPKKCFSYNLNDRNICMIRSLMWPGMIFFHKLNTKHQGFFYFGNGRKNLNLLMMT